MTYTRPCITTSSPDAFAFGHPTLHFWLRACFYAIWGWDEWGGFPLPSSQTIMGEQLVQGRYTVAWGRFEPATFWLKGTEHIPTPPRPMLCDYIFTLCDWGSGTSRYSETCLTCSICERNLPILCRVARRYTFKDTCTVKWPHTLTAMTWHLIDEYLNSCFPSPCRSCWWRRRWLLILGFHCCALYYGAFAYANWMNHELVGGELLSQLNILSEILFFSFRRFCQMCWFCQDIHPPTLR